MSKITLIGFDLIDIGFNELALQLLITKLGVVWGDVSVAGLNRTLVYVWGGN